jgi:hypothetical protein
MKDFEKVVFPGSINSYGRNGIKVFCKISFKNGNLSISGVEGPKANGNAIGGCGQIEMGMDNEYLKYFYPAENWTKDLFLKFIATWREWHLNDLQSGCEHQREMGWDEILLDKSKPKTQENMAMWHTTKENPNGLLSEPCPICGYKFGSAWLKKEIPQDVIYFLKSLPETELTPAWV